MTAAAGTARLGASVTLAEPVADAALRVRAALAEQGFGVLTEIDVRATMAAKLGIEVPEQLILGACNPPLAHTALEAEPDLGLLLPCNVVVRAVDGGSVVSVVDPRMMVEMTGNPALEPVAAEAGRRLDAVLAAVSAGRAG